MALEQLGEDAPALRRRVVALTRENDTLRAQLAALRKQVVPAAGRQPHEGIG